MFRLADRATRTRDPWRRGAWGVVFAALALGVVAAEQVRGPGLTVTITPDQPARYRWDEPGLTHPAGWREFYFTRAVYSSGGRRFRRQAWATDYPKADRQFLTVLTRLIDIDAYESENAIRLDDPELRRFPFLYALEVGDMALTDEELVGLRSYLDAGGFLMIDDFWGSWQWQNFEMEMQRLFPDRPIVDIPLDHPVFHMVYDIPEIVQVPAVNRAWDGGPTWEQDGYVPAVRGIFDDDGRLIVGINWNTDLGDAWEWAEDPYYPLKYSTFAFEMGVNFVVYAMSH